MVSPTLCVIGGYYPSFSMATTMMREGEGVTRTRGERERGEGGEGEGRVEEGGDEREVGRGRR